MMERAIQALSFIESTDREIWLMAGMALKHAHGDAAFPAWEKWSRSAKSFNEDDAKAVWKSIKYSGKITAGSLFHLARQNGWKPDTAYIAPSAEQIEQRRIEAEYRTTVEGREKARLQALAAEKAKNILSCCEYDRHGYLESHGFKDERGLVFKQEGLDPLLVIPMRYNGEVCGLQLIGSTGAKLFLRNQRSSEAEFIFGNSGIDLYCEGYCTGFAIHKALAALKITGRVHVCFSDSNLAKVAKKAGAGLIVADMEPSGAGVRAAIATGLPYWVSDKAPKDDFCDVYQREGLFKSSQLLRKFLMSVK